MLAWHGLCKRMPKHFPLNIKERVMFKAKAMKSMFGATATIAFLIAAATAQAQSGTAGSGYDKSGRSTGDATSYPGGKPQQGSSATSGASGSGSTSEASGTSSSKRKSSSKDMSSGSSTTPDSTASASGGSTPRPSGSGPTAASGTSSTGKASPNSGPAGTSGTSTTPGR